MGPRILIVNVNWVGDVLFSTPAIRALRAKYPAAHLACLVPPRCREVLAHNPRLDEVITASDDTSLAGLPSTLAAAARLRGKFDTAIFLHRSKTKAWIARLAGIRERAGFRSAANEGLMTRPVEPPAAKLHRTDIFLHLLEALGVPPQGRAPEFYPAPGSDAELTALLSSHGVDPAERYVVVHAGGNWDLKRWPAGHFVRWIRLFRARFPWKVVLCGTPPEQKLSDDIAGAFPEGVVSLCGKTSFSTLALLLKGSQFLVSNDSGPIHLAASQRVKTLALFGPTSPEETAPLGEARLVVLKKDVGCEIPCYFRACDHRVCMELLSPEEVFAGSEELALEAR